MKIRTRLTAVYGGLFFLAGLLLLALTYVLVSQRFRREESATFVTSGSGPAPSGAPMHTDIRGEIRGEVWQDALSALLTQGAIALLVVGAIAVAFGWLLAGRLLQPLHTITETAQRIASAPAAERNLHERIALRGPKDEVKQLADTFDVMLERLDHSFDGRRRFIANASHELRTPLTVNRALLEVALHENGDSPVVRQLAQTLLSVNSRHERLIDGLLLLVRSEQEVAEQSYVDLADIVEHVAAQVTAISGDVAVQAQPDPAPTMGNAVLLERLVQNLVDNAVRHNLPHDGWVRVTSGAEPDGTAVLQVSNTGPVVPKYDIPQLFEPFRRLKAERHAGPGAGLGLSIVQAITRAHGGTVQAEPRDGGGLVVTVVLPGE